MSAMNTLRLRTIEGHRPGGHVLILGGVHGDEYEPMAAIRRLAELLDPATLRGRVTLVPVLNEPAFQQNARTGPDGLDLARTFPGNPHGSVTERIAHAGAELIRSADFLIDLHTGGLAADVLPLVGYMLHPDRNVLDVQRRMARAFNLPIVWGTSPELKGRSLSVARDAKIPAIYAEWHGGGGCREQGVSDYVTGCLNVLVELEMLNGPLPESRIEYAVEDSREGSGHLQRNYKAPASGFFEPAVRLGDSIDVGDVLGAIYRPLGEPIATVRSTQRGVLLMLRALPRVEAGDCLAVVLELDNAEEP